MYFPKLSEPPQKRVTVDRFLGLDRRRRASEGALAAMENLTGAHYPALAVRCRRSAAGTAVKPGGLTAKDALIWVDGTALYVGGIKTGLVLTEGLKQLVSMGAYLVIWPDKKYINTKDLTDFGSLERRYESTGTVTLRLCRADGTDFGDWQAGDSAPEGAQSGALWVDTAAQTPVLRRFDGESWSAVDGVCVEIRAAGIGEGFQAGDGVEIDGCADERMNGSFLLERAESGAIVVPGILTQTVSQTETLTVSRSVPEMDYVIECGNRLWGCKYGLVDGETVNEIYASKLGDFKNWNCFAGLSTDSYAAARGSDGPFTGAADYLGSPIFFKEDCLERVYPSASGAHQIVTTRCSGVRRGDWRSVQVVDGKLYYHSAGGVCVFDGSLPVVVSQVLGEERYTDAAAGSLDGRYYLSAKGADGAWVLLVYDARRGLWHAESGVEAVGFTRAGKSLYALSADGTLWDLTGHDGTQEECVSWMGESGDLGLSSPENRYLQRLDLRMALESGSGVRLYVSYDGGASWELRGSMQAAGRVQDCLLHVRPRRAKQLRLRLTGEGGMVLYSVSAVYEKGSDGP